MVVTKEKQWKKTICCEAMLLNWKTERKRKRNAGFGRHAYTCLHHSTLNKKNTVFECKKGDEIIFNPAKAFGNETELASFLKISKEQAKEITSDFRFKINNITRYLESEINQELFDKVFGENTVSDEQEFRERIKEMIANNLKENSDYRFGIDAKKTLVEKFKDLTFPDTFLKRWLLNSNKNLTSEQIDSDYPKMIEDLTWQLIKEKLKKI